MFVQGRAAKRAATRHWDLKLWDYAWQTAVLPGCRNFCALALTFHLGYGVQGNMHGPKLLTLDIVAFSYGQQCAMAPMMLCGRIRDSGGWTASWSAANVGSAASGDAYPGNSGITSATPQQL